MVVRFWNGLVCPVARDGIKYLLTYIAPGAMAAPKRSIISTIHLRELGVVVSHTQLVLYFTGVGGLAIRFDIADFSPVIVSSAFSNSGST